ncbi:MAG: hypothetical protein MK135_02485 [Polyangiaceae bacterium]|nr:hypothetical protein [Polyangiaceae bacterium]
MSRLSTGSGKFCTLPPMGGEEKDADVLAGQQVTGVIPDLEVSLPRPEPQQALSTQQALSPGPAKASQEELSFDLSFPDEDLGAQGVMEDTGGENPTAAQGVGLLDWDDLSGNDAPGADPNFTLGIGQEENQTPGLDTSERRVDMAWPQGTRPGADEIEVSKEELKAAAGFGVAPQTVFVAPAYFFRVVLARREIAQRLALEQQGLKKAEDQRDEILAELALRLRQTCATDDRFSSLYQQLARAGSQVSDAKRRLSAADEIGSAALLSLDEELEQLGQALRLAAETAAQAEAAYQSTEFITKKAQATLQRILIEKRNLLSRWEEQEQEVDQSQLEDLEQKKSQAEDAVAEAQTVQAKSLEVLKKQRDILAQSQTAVGGAEARKEAEVLTQADELQLRSREVTEMRKREIAAGADIGRAILALRGEINIPDEDRRTLLEMEGSINDYLRRVVLLERTDEVLDRQAFDRGRWIVILGVTVLVAVVSWWFLGS